MLYDSTRALLQSILRSLETGDESQMGRSNRIWECMSLRNAPDVRAAVQGV